METATLAAVFFGVWLVLLFGYCVFKLCGGKLVDVFSCDCCGPCWGNGGRIDELDYEYPFADIDADAIRRRRAREERGETRDADDHVDAQSCSFSRLVWSSESSGASSNRSYYWTAVRGRGT